MSDLSNLLGDLYGDTSNPDGPPVRHEPAAHERNEWAGRTDDELAAALSAALAEPATPAPAPAPSMPEVPVAAAPAPAPMPVTPAPAAWTAAPEPMAAPISAPVSVPMQAAAGPRMWDVGDDDIVPMAAASKKRR